MLKLWFNAVGIVVSAFLMIGVIMPFMISSNTNVLPFLGFGILTVYIPLMYLWVKNCFKQIVNTFNGGNNAVSNQ